MQMPKGMQQTRTRIQRARLFCGTGFSLVDGLTRKPIMELSTALFPLADGFVLLRLFEGHDVLYRVILSEELKQCEVGLDKLVMMFISKLAMETHLAARLTDLDSQIDVEEDQDEENVVLLWLGDTLIGEFIVNGDSLDDVEIYTDLQGKIIRFQLADVFSRVGDECE